MLEDKFISLPQLKGLLVAGICGYAVSKSVLDILN